MLKLQNICKNYSIGKEEIQILKDINLEIEQGEFVAILGQSGCGKTTLLNLIAGMDKLNRGNIVFRGKRIGDFKDKQWSEWRKSHIGYVFQNFNLIEFLTAKQNIELVLQLNGVKKQERSKRADELLKMVGLADRVNHRPSQLSGGQKQRVAIARALANEPDILLADEPTGAVDSETANDIMELLRKINKEKSVTVLMVTHDNKLAEKADRKINMFDGRIVGDTVLCEKSEISNKELQKDKTSKSLCTSMMVAYRNIATKKKRTILTSLGTAIGIMGVLLVFGIGSGAKERVLKEVGTIVNNRVISASEIDKKMDVNTQNELLKDEAILNIYPNYILDAVCQYEDKVSGGMVQSIAPLSSPLPYWQDNLIYGSLPTQDNSREVMITSTMAEALLGEGEDIQEIIGKKINIIFVVSAENKLAYQVECPCVVIGICGKSFLGVEMIHIPYLTAQELTRESLKDETFITDSFGVTITDESEVRRVQEKLENLGFKVSVDEDALGSIGSMLDMITAVIMLIAGISLIVSGIMIALVTYMGVVERTREIGILRAIGFSQQEVQKIFVTEGCIIGLLAGGIGVLFASLCGAAVNAIIEVAFQDMAFTLYQVNGEQIVFCVLFSVILGLICSFSPARKAAKMEPVKALGYVQ